MKRWTQSRTIWLNIASIITTIAALALANLRLLGMSDYALFWWMLILTLVVNVCNIYLRLDTTEPIGKAPDDFKGEHSA